MKKRGLSSEDVSPAMMLILGAGASRGVSYAKLGGIVSPLDADFFDLLQRFNPAANDRLAQRKVLRSVRKLPYEHWRSMEKAFYTLHLRAYMHAKLENHPDDARPHETVIHEFAQCVQALLRSAHGKQVCEYHKRLCNQLHEPDTILSFNYDLVPERAIRSTAERRSIALEPWLYDLEPNVGCNDLPLILKLHGSSNWKLLQQGDGTDTFEVRTKDWTNLDEKPGYRAAHRARC